jgi:hypothetical protein
LVEDRGRDPGRLVLQYLRPQYLDAMPRLCTPVRSICNVTLWFSLIFTSLPDASNTGTPSQTAQVRRHKGGGNARQPLSGCMYMYWVETNTPKAEVTGRTSAKVHPDGSTSNNVQGMYVIQGNTYNTQSYHTRFQQTAHWLCGLQMVKR